MLVSRFAHGGQFSSQARSFAQLSDPSPTVNQPSVFGVVLA